MSFFGEEDIDAMLSDVGGVTVVHGTESGPGVLDSFDEELLRGDDVALVGKVIAVLVKSSNFPTIAKGSAVTISGAAHVVRDRMAVDDGALTRLLCKKV